MKRVCHIDDVVGEYDFDTDKHLLIEKGIQKRFDEMKYGTLKDVYSENSNLGFKLILWNMCSFPEFRRNGDLIELTERFSGVDTNPLIVRYNLSQSKKNMPSLECDLHEEVDLISDFVSEALIYSRFYKNYPDENLKKSSRAFFPDMERAPDFSVKNYEAEIEREIESLCYRSVIDCAFSDFKMDVETMEYFISEIVKTYFVRLEYNSCISKIIHERTPNMLKKLYGRYLDNASDIERVVSQTFVAHDWLRDEKDQWIESRRDGTLIYGSNVDFRRYLDAGEQFLLFEIVPSDIDESYDLQNYFGYKKHFFGGKTFRMIPEDAEMKESNDVQIVDLGNVMRELQSSPEDFVKYAQKVRMDLDLYRKKRPTMFVRKDRDLYQPVTI